MQNVFLFRGLEPLPMENFITEVLRNRISDTLRPSQCVKVISHFFFKFRGFNKTL